MRYVVMGSGEVGFHLARSLSDDGHEVTVIEMNPEKIERVRAQLDANMVLGDGSRRAVLGSSACFPRKKARAAP